ncbi:hypothetical protein HAX54_037023, partial [Datura stramonium]|nr:hypothetical protein [Datura stramonium]
ANGAPIQSLVAFGTLLGTRFTSEVRESKPATQRLVASGIFFFQFTSLHWRANGRSADTILRLAIVSP